MMKGFIVLTLIVSLSARDYPMYKQCDAKWANEHVGTSTSTMCEVGCVVSAMAMALSGIGRNFNPSTLNTWLKANGGFVNKDDFVWGSVNSLGLSFSGKLPNSLVRINLDVGYIVIIHVRKQTHWVLATGYDGTNIKVMDSRYDSTYYPLSELADNQNAVYKVLSAPIDQLPITILDL